MKQIQYIIIFLLLGYQGIAQQKKTHEFDEQNRLSKVFYWNNGSVTATIIYTFDEVGNRKTKVVNTTVSPQTIAISSPTSGTFTAGQSVEVSYSSTGGTSPVSLELVSCTNATAIAIIGEGVASSGTINYTLPSNLTVGQYRIKAYVTGTTGTPYYGTCFMVNPIATQTIAISSPTSGTFTAGQSVAVSYASTGGTDNVSLELVSCTGTTSLAIIADGVSASGTVNFALPNSLTTGQYRIKAYITGTSGTPFYGACFSINAIAAQTITINSPVSGTFTAGQSVAVTYASSGGTLPISLELVSCTGTIALAVIADGVSASGTVNFVLPSNLSTGQYRIKAYVTGTTGLAVYANCFTVNGLSIQTIAINSPTSGTFAAGQNITVSYASTGGSANVSLELVACTGTTALAVIADGVSASGSVNFTLPSNLSTGQYRIKAYTTGTTGQSIYGTCFTVNAVVQTIVISSPIGGTFGNGQNVTVSYASTGGSANISLELVSCTGTSALAVIADGVAASGSITYTLPTNLADGQYRIKAYVTGSNGQGYYGACFGVSTCPNQPDLVITAVNITKHAPNRVNYAVTVKNQGSVSASLGSVSLGVLGSPDALRNGNDIFKSAIFAGGGTLTPNQTYTINDFASFNFADANYYLAFSIDYHGLLTECNETNNDLVQLINRCSISGENVPLTGFLPNSFYAINGSVIIPTINQYTEPKLIIARAFKVNPTASLTNLSLVVGNCLTVPAGQSPSVNTETPATNKPLGVLINGESTLSFENLSKDVQRFTLWDSENNSLLMETTSGSIDKSILQTNKKYILRLEAKDAMEAFVVEK